MVKIQLSGSLSGNINYVFEIYRQAVLNVLSGWDNSQGVSHICYWTQSIVPFIGHYDGQGYRIDHLYINRPSVGRVGLFGYVESSTIKNLGLTNVDIAGGYATALLVGEAQSNTLLENCFSTGSVNSSEMFTAGLIAYVEQSTIENCYSAANVTNSGYKEDYVGGLIAAVEGNVLVENCYATSTINRLKVETGGSMTVQSTSDGTGSLIIPLPGDASGNINFQHYMDVNTKSTKWHYISSPLADVAIDDDFMTDNSIYSPNGGTNYNFYRWDEDNNYWNIYGSTGDPEPFGDGSFVTAKGYAVSRSSGGVITFNGSLRTIPVAIEVSSPGMGEGWHLIGNPFTSALAITADATQASQQFLTNYTNLLRLDDNYTALYIWDEGADYTYGRDDYKVIGNPVTGSYTQIDQDYVQPGQAFMVKASNSGYFQFFQQMQAYVPVNFYKDKEVWPSVELLAEGNGLSNATVVGFHEGMTKGLDPSYDVGKLKGNPDIALYTRLVEDNGIDFAIQALPMFKEAYSIPLGIDLAQTGEYSFEAVSIKEIPDDVNVYFEDKQSGNMVNMRGTNKYTCFINETGSITGRFNLYFTQTPYGEEELQTPRSSLQFWAANKTITLLNPGQLKGSVKIIDLRGHTIWQNNLNGNSRQTMQFDVPSAYYMIQIITIKGIETGKLFMQ